MTILERYMPTIASALLMCVVLFFIYPHYQYYVDPDGTAYLTISKRYASGDIQRAINGYWSPLACWLTAGMIKLGFDAILSGVIVNAIGAAGFLFISQSFFLRFDMAGKIQWVLNITLGLFMVYAIFWQSFDELWECFFLLFMLRLMLAAGFMRKPVLWIACGVLGALAYFAKAYCFPFFMLNMLVCTYVLSKTGSGKWMLVSFVSIAVMIACSVPWILALHQKYGIWTTATAGKLNMSWYLVGHPYWKEGIRLLLPPAYSDSPYYWEDPWYVNGKTPQFWTSWPLFGLQILRLGLNTWKFFWNGFQLSVFFPLVFIIAFISSFHKREKPLFCGPLRIVVIFFLLFPLGYGLVNFISRYLWCMVPLSMILGISLSRHWFKKGWDKLFYGAFAISFLLYPLAGMISMYDVGKTEYAIASELKKMNIHGSFTSIVKPGRESQQMERIAYFSGNSFYSLPGNINLSREDLLPELRRYKVNYYIEYTASSNSFELANRVFKDETGKPFPGQYKDMGRDGGFKVYTINPK